MEPPNLEVNLEAGGTLYSLTSQQRSIKKNLFPTAEQMQHFLVAIPR